MEAKVPVTPGTFAFKESRLRIREVSGSIPMWDLVGPTSGPLSRRSEKGRLAVEVSSVNTAPAKDLPSRCTHLAEMHDYLIRGEIALYCVYG